MELKQWTFIPCDLLNFQFHFIAFSHFLKGSHVFLIPTLLLIIYYFLCLNSFGDLECLREFHCKKNIVYQIFRIVKKLLQTIKQLCKRLHMNFRKYTSKQKKEVPNCNDLSNLPIKKKFFEPLESTILMKSKPWKQTCFLINTIEGITLGLSFCRIICLSFFFVML